MNRFQRLPVIVAAIALVTVSSCGSDYDAEPQADATSVETVSTSGGDDPYGYGAPSATVAEVAPPASSGPAIGVATDPEFGEFVVDQAGYSLYLFATDDPTTSTCNAGCAEAWPPVLADAAPAVADGLDAALVATIDRDDGTTQVTYGGHPLYRFAGDIVAGDTNGQASGGVWYLVDPAGSQIG